MIRLFFMACLCCACFTLSAQGTCLRGDCLSGNGKMRFPDGATYEGPFRKAEFHGLGILTYPGGARYVGNWRNSLQEGNGRMTDADGTSYVGGFHQGKRHGEGTVTFANKNEMKAVWAFDRLKGEVAFTFANTDYYEGETDGTNLSGNGTMRYANGDKYIGQWKDNQRHGKGKMLFEDGTELAGDWEGDNYHADWSSLGFQGDLDAATDCNGGGCPDQNRGKYSYPNGTTFYGKVNSSLPAGNGTVAYTNGNTYHGGFNNHQPEGLGIMYYADGEMHGGIWRNGALYRKIFTAMGRPAQNITPNFDPQVKVWAVVVGAARYTHMRTLKYTDDDAYQLAGFLRSVEGGALPNEQVKVLIDEDATHRNIIMAMRETYRRADENDVILFYFSGQGLKGSFLPVDYDGFANRLEHYQLRDALMASRARHKLVIADACHSGSLGGRDNAKGGAAGGGIDATLNAYYDALNNAQASTALLLSSKSEEISLEDGGLRSGIFSHYLIRGMQGEADSNGDKLVSIQELFNFVHREVRRYTGNIQTPTLTGTYDELMPVSVIRSGSRR
jgi:hypothetical protein